MCNILSYLYTLYQYRATKSFEFTILICCARKKGFRHTFTITNLTNTDVPARLIHFAHSASNLFVNRKTPRSLIRDRGTSIQSATKQLNILAVSYHIYIYL